MIWLSWRQHRAEVLTAGGALAVIAAILGGLGVSMHRAATAAVACATDQIVDPNICGPAIDRFQMDYSYAPTLTLLLNLLPFAVGGLIGAPLIARELESGTWQLAWTQAVPRMRWLTVKLVLTAGLTAVVTGAAAALATWYRSPLDAVSGRFTIDSFGVEGIVPAAYGLFAFATGAAAGALLRRTLPAITVTLVAFIVARAAVATELRPRFVKPFSSVDAIEPRAAGIRIGTGRPTDWMIDQAMVLNGKRLSQEELEALVDAAADANTPIARYLYDQGVEVSVIYHPGRHFWPLQYIEAGLFTALAVGLLAIVIWRVHRRLA